MENPQQQFETKKQAVQEVLPSKAYSIELLKNPADVRVVLDKLMRDARLDLEAIEAEHGAMIEHLKSAAIDVKNSQTLIEELKMSGGDPAKVSESVSKLESMNRNTMLELKDLYLQDQKNREILDRYNKLSRYLAAALDFVTWAENWEQKHAGATEEILTDLEVIEEAEIVNGNHESPSTPEVTPAEYGRFVTEFENFLLYEARMFGPDYRTNEQGFRDRMERLNLDVQLGKLSPAQALLIYNAALDTLQRKAPQYYSGFAKFLSDKKLIPPEVFQKR